MIEAWKGTLRLPVIMAPMFLISNPQMVLSACENGIIGTFPALNARTVVDLDKWMQEITESLVRLKKENPDKEIAPWGVNFISHRSNPRFYEDLSLIEKYQPPLVITSLGDPSPVVKVVHGYGGVVLTDVINIKFAKKALEKGADGLVLVAAGAGGHGGTYNPIAFIREVRTFFDGPIALAGALSRGEDILAAEILGADFAYIGTRFIPAEESIADPKYKQMVLESSIEDIVYTDQFSGIHANFLLPSIIQAGLDPTKLQSKGKVDFSALGKPDVKAWRDVWSAGQGVGAVTKKQTVKEIVEELEHQYKLAKSRVK